MSEPSFPPDFTWGTATAAHQIEGANVNNDWWDWEHQPGTVCAEPSGDACDSWHRWRNDIDVVASLGLSSYRFSLEWSRIEPAEGEWSHATIAHYLGIGEALLERGIEPVVTFHHFTTPRWVVAHGGWVESSTAERFTAFAERAARELAPVLRRACTLNEPNIVATMGYEMGIFPPGVTDASMRDRANETLIAAHRGAVDAIRSAATGVPVGLTLSMTDYQPATGGESTLQEVRRHSEDVFLDAVGGDDFLGVQAYTRMLVGPDGWIGPEPGVPTTAMGYEYWPEALEATIRRAWDYTGGGVPIIVTENGIGTDDDEQRIAYVRTALEGVLACLSDGIDVRGYTYWSLLDNFEWVFGYRPRFGLVAVDRETFERTPKPSAQWYAEVARTGRLT
ncbi:MAG: glycoside hydrolase family 1 protein [Actinomycetes bacterium]